MDYFEVSLIITSSPLSSRASSVACFSGDGGAGEDYWILKSSSVHY